MGGVAVGGAVVPRMTPTSMCNVLPQYGVHYAPRILKLLPSRKYDSTAVGVVHAGARLGTSSLVWQLLISRPTGCPVPQPAHRLEKITAVAALSSQLLVIDPWQLRKLDGTTVGALLQVSALQRERYNKLGVQLITKKRNLDLQLRGGGKGAPPKQSVKPGEHSDEEDEEEKLDSLLKAGDKPECVISTLCLLHRSLLACWHVCIAAALPPLALHPSLQAGRMESTTKIL